MSQYRGGLLSVTQNSNVVQGIGTEWLTNVEPGDMLLVTGDTNIYSVSAVASDTQLTIVGTYQASTKSGVNYAITRDFTPNRNYPIPVGGDIEAIRIFGQTIKMIDADIGSGSGGGGGGGAAYLNDLLDVRAVNVPTGFVMTKLADGTFGFESVVTASVSGANLGTAGIANGAELFAGLSGSNLTFRRLRGQNITVTQDANNIVLTAPSPGEVNTASSAGSASAFSIFKDKVASNLRFYGLRAGSGMTIVPEGDDLVLSSTATGGTSGGEANTSSNVGTGNVALAAAKSGVNLPFKTINFPADRFGVTESANTFTVAFKAQPLSAAPDTSIATATTGQVLRRDSDGLWKGATLPSPGIASVSADTNPSLGGDLNTAGRKILGIADTFSGLIEKPKSKSYVLVLSTNKPITLTGLVTRLVVGTLEARIDIGGYPDSSPSGRPPGAIESSVSTTTASASPTATAAVPAGSEITLTLINVSADAADFSFSLSFASA